VLAVEAWVVNSVLGFTVAATDDDADPLRNNSMGDAYDKLDDRGVNGDTGTSPPTSS